VTNLTEQREDKKDYINTVVLLCLELR